jgi:hypothetical protein
MRSFDINSIHGPHGRRFILLLLTIILGLSTYTHIWNPIGFPTFQTDEGEYIAHGMHFLKGLGVQESSFYDHPYFGQVFLAAIFRLIIIFSMYNVVSVLSEVKSQDTTKDFVIFLGVF